MQNLQRQHPAGSAPRHDRSKRKYLFPIFLVAVCGFSIALWAVNFTISIPGIDNIGGKSVPSREAFLDRSQQGNNKKEDPSQWALSSSSLNVDNIANSSGGDTNQSHGNYAYVWLIGGIDETTRAHEGLLWGVLVAARLLRSYGSTADFILYARLSSSSGGNNALPPEDAKLLDAAGFRTIVLDPPNEQEDTFAGIVYEKFRPLSMLEYQRIMFLDCDIMPTVNMDYLFRLSEGPNPVIGKNFFYATRGEPCNTGVFMMTPEEGEYDELLNIVRRQHEEGAKMDYPHFDWDRGWGHNFKEAKDKWEAVNKNGNGWMYHAGHSDQGLWYYYVKYHKMDGSIAIGSRLQTIKPGDDGKPVLKDEEGALAKYDPEPIKDFRGCKGRGSGNFLCYPGYRDFVHFSGEKKPWLQVPHSKSDLNDPLKFWHNALSEMNDEYGMGLDMNNYKDKVLPRLTHSPLGYMAQRWDHAQLVLKRKEQAMDGKDVGSDKLQNESEQNNAIALPESLSGDNLLDPLTVAYAVSFIKCGDFQTHSAGLTDASLILRHSIHKISKRNPSSGSKYDYKMYAIVHRDAQECSGVLRDVGFEVVVVDPPVNQKDIRGEYLRKNIHREWCCGSDEFIKLYAYTLPAEIIVHVDIDFAFYKPMDALFDSIRFDKDSVEGQAARSQILLERPDEGLPDRIDAFLTKDWPQVAPNKFPPGYQAGFLVARRNPSALSEITDVILEGNYTNGWGRGFGWGNTGHGGYVGAMAMQGLLAYYYDFVQPNNVVELNQCRYNHMGMDVLYRKHPNFRPGLPGVGGCRNGAETCEDCMVTPMDDIYSVHYTMCRKPWQCQATGAPGGKAPGKGRASAINTDTVHLDHCMELVKRWHDLRADFEEQLYELTKDEAIKSNGMEGTYRPEVFRGHCKGDGNDNYLLISASKESLKRSDELYR